MFKHLLAKPLPLDQVSVLVNEELAAIVHHCQPEAVYLFGSAARGEMTDASDLDFLVIMPDAADCKTLKAAYYRSRRSKSIPVDVVFMFASQFQGKSRIGGVAMICAQEGRLIYQMDKGVDG